MTGNWRQRPGSLRPILLPGPPDGTGTTSSRSGVVEQDVSYSLAAPPAGRPRAISSVRITAHFMNPKPQLGVSPLYR